MRPNSPVPLTPELAHLATRRSDAIELYAPTDESIDALLECQDLRVLHLRAAKTVSDGALERLAAAHPKLEELTLDRADALTDAGLIALKRLGLSRLDLSSCPGLTAKGLAAFGESIESLRLARLDQMGGAILKELAGWPRLERLALFPSKLAAKDLAALSDLERLTRFDLRMPPGKRLSAPSSKALNGLPDGSVLRFGHANDKEIKALVHLRPEIRLSVGFRKQGRRDDKNLTKVTDAIVELLGRITGLWALDLGDIDVANVSQLGTISSLRHLNLFGDRSLKNEDIEALAGLALDSLNVGGRTVNRLKPKALKTLSEVRTLRDLSLAHLRVTDASLKHLAALKLTGLDLGDSLMPASDRGMQHLAAIDSLEQLTISDSGKKGLTGETATALSELAHLEQLDITLKEADAPAFEALARLPKLRALRVNLQHALEDAHLLALAKAPALEVLEFSEYATCSRLTTAAIEALGEHPTLRTLNFNATDQPKDILRGSDTLVTGAHSHMLLVQPSLRWWSWPFNWSL